MYKGEVLEDMLSTVTLSDLFYRNAGAGEADMFLDFQVYRYFHGNPHNLRIIDQNEALEKFDNGLFEELCFSNADDYQACSNAGISSLVQAKRAKGDPAALPRIVDWLNTRPSKALAYGSPRRHDGGPSADLNYRKLILDHEWKGAWCINNCDWTLWWKALCGAPIPGDAMDKGDIRSKINFNAP